MFSITWLMRLDGEDGWHFKRELTQPDSGGLQRSSMSWYSGNNGGLDSGREYP